MESKKQEVTRCGECWLYEDDSFRPPSCRATGWQLNALDSEEGHIPRHCPLRTGDVLVTLALVKKGEHEC
jgi:hypothetical protein